MKTIHGLFAMAMTIITATSLVTVMAQNRPQSAAGVTHISGGITEDSRAEMKKQAGQFNTRASFVTKSGAYMSEVDVTVTDSSGKPVLATKTEGPWLYARLAPGNYEMRANAGGTTQTQKFTVPAQGARELTFRWQSEL